MQRPPLVLVHGLWDTPRLFDRLLAHLDGAFPQVLVPHLPHGLGRVPIGTMARWLNHEINGAFGAHSTVDILGFSMGGLISRCWIQEHEGHSRTRRFVCVGSPQRGTLTAQLVPRRWLPSIADMKLGSSFVRRLERARQQQPEQLEQIECHSFYCQLDLMVVPAWRGVLPVGSRRALPVWTHPQLIMHPVAIQEVAETLLQDPIKRG
jgi:triacylglycerol lipase